MAVTRPEPYTMEQVEQLMADTPMYSPEFIIDEICKMDKMTTAEFSACTNYDMLLSLISFGNLGIGLIIGYVFARGVFDVWR